ncbi:MAG: four helix bundle protein [Deltaproteobacteria bacterium]|nr:four helix bundle protein [Deltaproteobacteria bacterium]
MERPRQNDLHRLDVCHCALELYRRVGRMIAQFPRGEADLRSQMRRASRRVPFNIGEGVGKRGRPRAAAYEVAFGEAKEPCRGPWAMGRDRDRDRDRGQVLG